MILYHFEAMFDDLELFWHWLSGVRAFLSIDGMAYRILVMDFHGILLLLCYSYFPINYLIQRVSSHIIQQIVAYRTITLYTNPVKLTTQTSSFSKSTFIGTSRFSQLTLYPRKEDAKPGFIAAMSR